MAVTRRRSAVLPDELTIAAHEFIYNRATEASATRVKNTKRDLLKGWLTMKNALGKFVNGRVDENGHRYFDFAEPITIGDETYKAIVAQRKTSSYIDEAAVEEFLKAKGDSSYDLVFKREVVRVFNEEALYVLNQKGVITDDELDALTVEDESYSLTTVKA
jgi:hypothetical protein